MSSVGLWDGNSEPTTSVVLLYSNQRSEFLELVNEKVINKPDLVFFIKDTYHEYSYIFLRYISYKYSLDISTEGVNSQYWEDFFSKWDRCIKDFSLFSNINFKSRDTSVLYSTSFLIELLKKISSFRSTILSNSPYLGYETRYFDHAWWLKPMPLLKDLIPTQQQLSRVTKSKSSYKLLLSYLESVSTIYDDIGNSSLQTRLITASAFMFASGKHNARSGECDKSLLLLHRCLDMAFQYIAASEGVVKSNNENLYYTRQPNRPVNLDTTKNLLIKSHIISISGTHLKTINRINFSRNRSALTHSFYTILPEELDILYKKTYQALTHIIDQSDRWKVILRGFLDKPEVPQDLLFTVEDSFDSLLQQIK